MVVVTCTISVQPGDEERFHHQLETIIEMVRDREAVDCLLYSYFSHPDDQKLVEIVEVYRDWDDLRSHSQNVASVAPGFHTLFTVVELKICGAGLPSDIRQKYTDRLGKRVAFYGELISA